MREIVVRTERDGVAAARKGAAGQSGRSLCSMRDGASVLRFTALRLLIAESAAEGGAMIECRSRSARLHDRSRHMTAGGRRDGRAAEHRQGAAAAITCFKVMLVCSFQR
jgi:hypothetical protein